MIRVPGDIYIPVNDLAEIEPRAGNDVVTTLDVNIQDAAENALLKALQRHDADHGCAIVMEVKTGAIRAMANIGRTPNGWWETYNHAIGTAIEPGSTFKIVPIAGALSDGVVSLDQEFDCERGAFFYGGRTLRDHHAYHLLTVEGIITKSSNIGAAKIGILLESLRP
jgi:cell division protein FtsI (penicillin-binding protein 3)